ncbi:hypothetical protein B0H13DRAFT_1980717, partial [Mycena leptocephala]
MRLRIYLTSLTYLRWSFVFTIRGLPFAASSLSCLAAGRPVPARNIFFVHSSISLESHFFLWQIAHFTRPFLFHSHSLQITASSMFLALNGTSSFWV